VRVLILLESTIISFDVNNSIFLLLIPTYGIDPMTAIASSTKKEQKQQPVNINNASNTMDDYSPP